MTVPAPLDGIGVGAGATGAAGTGAGNSGLASGGVLIVLRFGEVRELRDCPSMGTLESRRTAISKAPGRAFITPPTAVMGTLSIQQGWPLQEKRRTQKRHTGIAREVHSL